MSLEFREKRLVRNLMQNRITDGVRFCKIVQYFSERQLSIFWYFCSFFRENMHSERGYICHCVYARKRVHVHISITGLVKSDSLRFFWGQTSFCEMYMVLRFKKSDSMEALFFHNFWKRAELLTGLSFSMKSKFMALLTMYWTTVSNVQTFYNISGCWIFL